MNQFFLLFNPSKVLCVNFMYRQHTKPPNPAKPPTIYNLALLAMPSPTRSWLVPVFKVVTWSFVWVVSLFAESVRQVYPMTKNVIYTSSWRSNYLSSTFVFTKDACNLYWVHFTYQLPCYAQYNTFLGLKQTLSWYCAKSWTYNGE